jgi:uncharacterized protein (TIGR03437 family)
VLSPSDIAAGVLPTALPGAGVRVTIAGVPAPLYYTGPTQVNFLVPSNLLPGKHVLRLMLDGRYGPAVEVEVAAAAPGFYTLEPGRLVATRADGSLIDKEHPIQGGEDVVFYGTGMGTTVPQPRFAELAPGAAPLANPRDFRVLVDGVTLPTSRIYYAGLTPGFAGLYQLNIQLPDTIGEDPEIRVVCGEYPSPAGLKLYGHPAPQAESTATSAR